MKEINDSKAIEIFNAAFSGATSILGTKNTPINSEDVASDVFYKFLMRQEPNNESEDEPFTPKIGYFFNAGRNTSIDVVRREQRLARILSTMAEHNMISDDAPDFSDEINSLLEVISSRVKLSPLDEALIFWHAEAYEYAGLSQSNRKYWRGLRRKVRKAFPENSFREVN